MDPSLEIKQREDGSPPSDHRAGGTVCSRAREAVRAAFWAWWAPGVFTVGRTRPQLWEGGLAQSHLLGAACSQRIALVSTSALWTERSWLCCDSLQTAAGLLGTVTWEQARGGGGHGSNSFPSGHP